MIIVNAPQGSPAWHDARLGVLTASMTDRLFTPARLELSKQRADLMSRLLGEWMTGSPADDLGSHRWIEHGRNHEGDARDRFAEVTGLEPRAVGFVYRDEQRLCGCSPDWLVPRRNLPAAGAEVKCPAPWTHTRWMLDGDNCPREHTMQVQFSLWVTGLPVWYFMSYLAPADHMEPWKAGAAVPPLIVTCKPEARYQDAFDEHVPAFLREMLEAREALREMGVRAAMDEVTDDAA